MQWNRSDPSETRSSLAMAAKRWSSTRGVSPLESSSLVEVSHEPPRERVEGMLTLDDVAVVSWDDDTLLLDGQDTRDAPNAWEFLELDAPPGEHRLSLVLAELRRRS